ncbi:hypothetical protein ACFVHB_03040 [Kitasatospora sp. NPDC127111]|uniref:hypothetical protein n=1 Tax=Kitasatospora sp. NPDC127111 TaxID=3345363 RepID=UPI003631383C
MDDARDEPRTVTGRGPERDETAGPAAQANAAQAAGPDAGAARRAAAAPGAGTAAAGRPDTPTAAKTPARLVFRDPLDQQSRDDTDAGWGERPGGGSGGRGLDWYLSQRPPHHGD